MPGDPFGPISAGIGAGADVYSAMMQSSANKKQIQAQKDMAREQMTFQERMSNTAHQREITDLKAAGLNPILSAGGGGLSTPPGAMPVLQNEMSGVGEKITSASNQIQQGLLNKSQIATQESIQRLNSATALDTLNKVQISGPKANVMAVANKLITSAKQVPGALNDIYQATRQQNRIEHEIQRNKERQKRSITVENAPP